MLTEALTEKASRQLAFLLRHSPESVNFRGWASFNAITAALSDKLGVYVSSDDLRTIAATDAKGRYEVEDYRIRAVQGHSHPVNLGLVSKTPPEFLYHGTVERFIDSIATQGLLPQSRTHVHLSASTETASEVAGRRSGEQVILVVSAQLAAQNGIKFFESTNGVWLATQIPAEFLEIQ